MHSLFCLEFDDFDSLERPHKLKDSGSYPPEHIVSRCREQEKSGKPSSAGLSTASTPLLPSFLREVTVDFVKNYSEQPEGTSVPRASSVSSSASSVPVMPSTGGALSFSGGGNSFGSSAASSSGISYAASSSSSLGSGSPFSASSASSSASSVPVMPSTGGALSFSGKEKEAAAQKERKDQQEVSRAGFFSTP